MLKYRISGFVLTFIVILTAILAPYIKSQSCTPSGPEIPNNGIDENCDGWLETTYGYNITASHPRVVLTQEKLNEVIDRMYGPNAREPYKTWFERIKAREDETQTNPSLTPNLMDLALIYRATGEEKYLEWYRNRLYEYLMPGTPGDYSGPSLDCFYSMDLMWNYINDTLKLKAYELSSAINAFYWHSGANLQEQNFYYHGAAGRDAAFAFAAIYAFDEILNSPEITNNPETYSFNTSLYIKTIMEELYPGGMFWDTENRIAGNTTYNNALPGDCGGMYDNFGYDHSEESHSIYLISEFFTATGQNRIKGFLHDQCRGRFYQNFEVPHRIERYGSGENYYEVHQFARIWNTQTVWYTTPNRMTVALVSSKYNDPYMQYYADIWRKAYNVYNYDYYITALWWMLLYYNDSIPILPPSSNPTARYFNGPGLVTMRSDWTENATFAVFIAGEGISRRYEDANSFIIHRKTDLMPRAGARIRRNYDNHKHHWYHIRSISTNTLKIFDPDECFDIDEHGHRGALHSGQKLVPSDNMGGQMFETHISSTDGGYGDGPGRPGCDDCKPNGEMWETANIIKYEHVPGEYTYAAGNGTEAYTRKIDYYIREFVFLRPDTFVIFDKVRSVNPAFKKVWVVHTVDEPVIEGQIEEQSNGMKARNNTRLVIMNSRNKTVTYFHMLVPEKNRVVVRGGDTILAYGELNPSHPITNIRESDIPRWVELFAVGGDTEGTLTIHGDAEEGNGVSEDIVFDGTYHEYLGSYPTGKTPTTLEDKTQSWLNDEWKGYVLHLRGGASEDVVIRGNNDTTLFVDEYNPDGVWGYAIRKFIENSYYHWKRITSITTSDMSVENLTVSTPHYFDAENAYGKLYSFSPHTDGRDDQYKKRPDFGQWTLNIEATEPREEDNFLNVLFLADPGVPDISTETISTGNITGILVNGSRFVLFSNIPENITNAQYKINISDIAKNLILDLKPLTTYNIYDNGQRINTLVSSSMGTLYFNLSAGEHSVTISETEPQDCESVGGSCRESPCQNYRECSSFIGICGSGYCCLGECLSLSPADINRNGRIEISEIINFIKQWKSGEMNISEIFEAIKEWKKSTKN